MSLLRSLLALSALLATTTAMPEQPLPHLNCFTEDFGDTSGIGALLPTVTITAPGGLVDVPAKDCSYEDTRGLRVTACHRDNSVPPAELFPCKDKTHNTACAIVWCFFCTKGSPIYVDLTVFCGEP